MARELVVRVVGDSRQLTKELDKSAKAAQKFSRTIGSSSTGAGLRREAAAVDEIVAAEERLIRVRSKRAKSIGPFRVAGVGLAASLGLVAATQAVAELAEALETTGKEAFTTEGRLKNMTAALLGGNFVDAIKAFTRQPETLEELGISAVYTTKQMAALQKVADGTTASMTAQAAAAHGDVRPAFEELEDIYEAAGTKNRKLAKELLDTRNALLIASAATEVLNDWTARLGQTMLTQTGAVVTFKGAVDDLARAGRGEAVGALAIPFRRQGRPTLPPLSPSQRRELSLIGQEGMQRIPELSERLRQLNNQMRDFHGNQEQRLKTLTNIRNTEAEIANIYADDIARRKAMAEAAEREAEAARAAARARELAREMRLLEGPIPTRENLLRQFEQIQKRAAADRDFPNKLLKRFSGVARLLREDILPETREAINEFFETVRGEFDKEISDRDPLAGLMQASTKRLTSMLGAGLGLGPGGRRILGANISGLQMRPVYLSVQLDGREVGRATTKEQKRTGNRTGAQTSGRRG